MFYFLTEVSAEINQKIQVLLKLPPINLIIILLKRNFLWADDLAFLIKAHPNRAKDLLKIYFETLILLKLGSKWGLTIIFNKSAIIEFFTLKTSYDYLSDHKMTWIKDKGAYRKIKELFLKSSKKEFFILHHKEELFSFLHSPTPTPTITQNTNSS